jgi:hypothetical protein
MGAARDVGKGLVDGNPLDEGGEIVDHLDGGIAQPLIVLEMAADKGELRTELARLPSRHAAAHPEGLGFVRSGKHDPTTDGNGLAKQRRVEQLLDRGIEGIQVCMENGRCCFHLDLSPRCSREALAKHNENMRWRLSSCAQRVCLISPAAGVQRTRVRFASPSPRLRASLTLGPPLCR